VFSTCSLSSRLGWIFDVEASFSRRTLMNAQSGAEKNRAGPKQRDKHLSYDESVDEDAKLIDAEPVEVEAEVPAEENEPIEGTTQNDKPPPPAFEE
jgi:hypothetical protein